MPLGTNMLKGKLKNFFSKGKTADEDLDALTQLARLCGVSGVKFPRGFAPGDEILVPSRFAALAQYLIDHGKLLLLALIQCSTGSF